MAKNIRSKKWIILFQKTCLRCMIGKCCQNAFCVRSHRSNFVTMSTTHKYPLKPKAVWLNSVCHWSKIQSNPTCFHFQSVKCRFVNVAGISVVHKVSLSIPTLTQSVAILHAECNEGIRSGCQWRKLQLSPRSLQFGSIFVCVCAWKKSRFGLNTAPHNNNSAWWKKVPNVSGALTQLPY